jgi:Uma2 family endonuclease
MATANEMHQRHRGGSQRGEPAWDLALLYPRQGSWTESDYLGLSSMGMIELTDGSIEVLPMPTKAHQRIVRFLFLLLQRWIDTSEVGEVFFAPMPVRLGPGRFREPDIVVLLESGSEFRGHPQGADLVMEVVSPGEENRRRDLEIKPVEYASAGIKEYWIIDPEKAEIHVLHVPQAATGDTAARYAVHQVFRGDEAACSSLLAGFQVAAREVLDAAG